MIMQATAGSQMEFTGPSTGSHDPQKKAQGKDITPESISARAFTSEPQENSPPQNQIPLTLLNHLPGMVYCCLPDKSRTMEYASEGCFDLTGYQAVDFVKNKTIRFGQLIHSEDREVVASELEAASREKRSYEIVYRINTAGGEEKWVRDAGRGVQNPNSESSVLEGFVTDITEQKLSEIRIQRQMGRFEALRKIDLAITSSFDLRVTLEVLLQQVTAQLNIDAADVLLFNASTQTLDYAAGRGFRTSTLQRLHLQIGEGLAGRAAQERRMIRLSNLPEALSKFGKSYSITPEHFVAYFGVPLIAKGQVKGILEIYHRSLISPDEEWLDFLEALAGQTAIAIDNATLFNDLQRSNIELNLAYNATLEGWSKALELRDQETEGHTKRVTEMTLRLAQSMGINHGNLLHIQRGAVLHDIGKMGIPDSILLKPGPLNDYEWEIMRQHPVYAYKLLSPISNLSQALDIPYCHHEKWDGTGYPRGLREEQIPLSARIFTIVDVWDALLSDRPYRPAWPMEKVIQYIRNQSGKHFEPDIVKAFLRLV